MTTIQPVSTLTVCTFMLGAACYVSVSIKHVIAMPTNQLAIIMAMSDDKLAVTNITRNLS